MKPLAITCGDPAGVGPELLETWLRQQSIEADDIVAIGPWSWLQRLSCSGLAVGPNDYQLTPGRPDETGQKVALAAMELAAQGTREGRFRAVVSGPIHKKNMAQAGFTFPGQTEFFAERWSGHPVMALSLIHI